MGRRSAVTAAGLEMRAVWRCAVAILYAALCADAVGAIVVPPGSGGRGDRPPVDLLDRSLARYMSEPQLADKRADLKAPASEAGTRDAMELAPLKPGQFAGSSSAGSTDVSNSASRDWPHGGLVDGLLPGSAIVNGASAVQTAPVVSREEQVSVAPVTSPDSVVVAELESDGEGGARDNIEALAPALVIDVGVAGLEWTWLVNDNVFAARWMLAIAAAPAVMRTSGSPLVASGSSVTGDPLAQYAVGVVRGRENQGEVGHGGLVRQQGCHGWLTATLDHREGKVADVIFAPLEYRRVTYRAIAHHEDSTQEEPRPGNDTQPA